MNNRDEEALKHFLKSYKLLWDLNQTARDNYDDDLEYFTGYRNEADYPLAYNMTFPQLLPRIMTMLSRMLEQLYQGGTGDLAGVRPRKKADVERAPRVQGLLNYQLETLNDIDAAGSSYLFNYQWMCNALSWGTGIAKLYWRKEERIAPKRVQFPVPKMDPSGRLLGFEWRSITQQAPQIVYDAPYAEILHNKCFLPHPHYKLIQKMPFCGCIYKRSVDYLKMRERDGTYRNIKELGCQSAQGSGAYGSQHAMDSGEAIVKSLEIEGMVDIGSTGSDRMSPEVDVLEMYGKYIFPEDDAAYEIGSGVKVKGIESEAIVHIGNYKTILKIQKNTYGYKPFFNIGAYRHPEVFWDMGIIRLGKSIQEQYDTLANTRYQGALMQVNPMLLVEEDSNIPPEALIWKPFGIIPGLADGIDQVKALTIPDNYGATFREQEDFFKSTIEDMTGMYRYNMGGTPDRQEHVGTVMSLQQMGESRIKLLLMTMDFQGFQPLLKYMMLLNTWHLPDNFEARINGQQGAQFQPLFAGDIHPDYDFTARYTAMEPAMSKNYRAQQLLQYAQLWAQSPYLQQYEFMKSVMEMMDFYDTDKYLKTPQQVQQEQQEMLKQQVMMKSMEMQAEDAMAGKQSQRDMTRDVVKQLIK